MATAVLLDGRPVAISGDRDGTLRLWDLQTGAAFTDPLRAHRPVFARRGVEALATATLPNGRPIAVSGGSDWTIRLWDLQVGTALTDPLGGMVKSCGWPVA